MFIGYLGGPHNKDYSILGRYPAQPQRDLGFRVFLNLVALNKGSTPLHAPNFQTSRIPFKTLERKSGPLCRVPKY